MQFLEHCKATHAMGRVGEASEVAEVSLPKNMLCNLMYCYQNIFFDHGMQAWNAFRTKVQRVCCLAKEMM